MPAAHEPPAPERRGAASRAAIPREVLAALNAGEIETKSLVEALAIDFAKLAQSALPPILGAHAEPVIAAARAGVKQKLGFAERTRALGAAVAEQLGAGAARARRVEALSRHRSDTVRGWCAYALAGERGLALDESLSRIRVFAADAHFGVREFAWLAVRPALADEIERGIALLTPWTHEHDANLRRFASEATRPRGVWCAHIALLRREPERGLALLEPLRSDPSRYVRDSVANWLNDSAKDQPAFVREVCSRWQRESPTPETEQLVKRALRSLRRAE
jgi:3-methyladenine DNA glycosylase AlkC